MGCSTSAPVVLPVVPPAIPPAKFEDKYTLGQKIGHGSFGEVYAAHRLQTTTVQGNVQHVAVKVIELQIPAKQVDNTEGSLIPLSGDRYLQKKVSMEFEAWRRVGTHRHCVRLLETFGGSARAYFVMERCQCSLRDMLRAKPLDTVQRAGAIFSHMLQGIAHVHSVGIVHRDVKPDNFLAGGPAGDIIKLCDFGLGAPLPQAGSVRHGKLGGTHGTPAFMSPEMLLAAGYDERTDVWSLGAMCYFLLFGSWAYAPKAKRADEMKDAIRAGTPGPDYHWHGQCRTCVMEPFDVHRFEPFLKQTLQRDPSARPFASALFMELPRPEACNERCLQPYQGPPSKCTHAEETTSSWSTSESTASIKAFGDMKPTRLCTYGSDLSTRDGSNVDSSSPRSAKSAYVYRSTGSLSR